MRMFKNESKHKTAVILSCSAAVVIALSAGVVAFVKFSPSEPETNTLTYSEAVSTSATTTPQTSATTTTTTETAVQTSASQKKEPATNVQTKKSFYDGVKYRSPTAKVADFSKHGRNLILLNNDYELPEDFKWDLVYWSNGKSVNAMSLNSKKYDSVKAVDREAYKPLKEMFKAAEDAGLPLELVSAYRSIDKQNRLFVGSVNSYMKKGYSEKQAIKKANYERTFPGTSEHNVGYGFDILQKGSYNLTTSFENTAEFKWLSEHAEEYGFILRYNKDKISITGIMYEPWHFRYVGVENAKKINEMNFCLEEYIEYLEENGL